MTSFSLINMVFDQGILQLMLFLTLFQAVIKLSTKNCSLV